MAIATDQQVQRFVDNRLRVRAEQVRSLLSSMQDDKLLFDDIYSALTQPSPTWTDSRSDGPPHLVEGNDVLAFNTFLSDLISAITSDGQYAVIRKFCVNPE